MTKSDRKRKAARKRGPYSTFAARINNAPTLAEKRHIALTGRGWPTLIERLADDWQTIRDLRAMMKTPMRRQAKAALETLGPHVQADTQNFMIGAMAHNRPADLRALADAMERKREPWTPDKKRLAVIRELEREKPNFYALAKRCKELGIQTSERELRRLKKQLTPPDTIRAD